MKGVRKECLESLHNLEVGEHEVDLMVLTSKPPGKKDPGRNVAFSMERARMWCLQHDYDALLKVDDDMVLPPHALLWMMKVRGDVITALTPERPEKLKFSGWAYPRERADQFTQCMPYCGNKDVRARILGLNPFEITGVGGEACMLVKRRALERNPFPSQRHLPFEYYAQAHKLGLRCMCNPRVITYQLERNSSQVIRGPDWTFRYWSRRVSKRGFTQAGLPYNWWRGMNKNQFLAELPKHLNPEKEPRWFLYFDMD